MDARPDVSVVIPALGEAENLAALLPDLRAVLHGLGLAYEILVVTQPADAPTADAARRAGARVISQPRPGYGGACAAGLAQARGLYTLTLDADLSHPPAFIADLWQCRHAAEVTIASRYVPGGSAHMPPLRYWLSRGLNGFFSRGLSLAVRDMSSGFRLYLTDVLAGLHLAARDFDILQELLVRAYAQGWRVQEVPFAYAPRRHGRSNARLLPFGLAYLRTFWSLWKLRNSIRSADYDSRAYDSLIPLQRYWQRQRFRHVTGLLAGQGPVLDVGCGSSRIIAALPPGSVALDISLAKLRYARRYTTRLAQASGGGLPFANGAFACVLCSQVIEHVPQDVPILDELCRVLAPGGLLVLGTPDYDHWEWRVTEWFYGRLAPGGYEDEHITRYGRRQLLDLFGARGFTCEAQRYILRGELILALRKGSPA